MKTLVASPQKPPRRQPKTTPAVEAVHHLIDIRREAWMYPRRPKAA